MKTMTIWKLNYHYDADEDNEEDEYVAKVILNADLIDYMTDADEGVVHGTYIHFTDGSAPYHVGLPLGKMSKQISKGSGENVNIYEDWAADIDDDGRFLGLIFRGRRRSKSIIRL